MSIELELSRGYGQRRPNHMKIHKILKPDSEIGKK